MSWRFGCADRRFRATHHARSGHGLSASIDITRDKAANMIDPETFKPSPMETWEMPSRVISMETIDGRLFVVLEDGRTVDATDLFGDPPPARAQ